MPELNEVLQVGLEHHKAGRLMEAERSYRQALAIHPRHAQTFHLLGLLAFQAEKPELAAEYVEQAIKIDAFHAPFQVDMAEIYRALGRTNDAIAVARKAVTLDPEAADAHTTLGMLLDEAGQHEEAVACYQQAIEANPEYAVAHAAMGTALERAGKLDEAQASFERATQLSPGSAEIYIQLGRLLHSRQKLVEAVACYQKAKQLQPDHPVADQLAQQARAAIASQS
ncbi:MAG: tetratricopeptide repeat protein [Planctomycetota bacterium]|mgnify:CR=1 FL=1|nr:MAG: tetratricopeptide repeat protein [Planctomycetota bacterium]